MWIYWTLLIGANLPVFWLVSKAFFKDLDDLGAAIGFWIRPDLFSAFAGEFWEDWWAELKLGAFLMVCSGIVYWEHTQFGETLMAMFGA